ncbi:hypothetical protein EMCRGX_G010202 [Ephydatia muelleri]
MRSSCYPIRSLTHIFTFTHSSPLPTTPTSGAASMKRQAKYSQFRKTESNNGTEVKCLVIGYDSSTTVSAPVILTLQGTLGAPSEFSVRLTTSTSFVYFWRPPFSLNITRSSVAFFYHICTNVSMLKCSDVTDAAECDFTSICNRTINFTNMITNVEAICLMQTPVLFTIFAVNGAGIGNSSYYIFDPKSDTSCLTTSLECSE